MEAGSAAPGCCASSGEDAQVAQTAAMTIVECFIVSHCSGPIAIRRLDFVPVIQVSLRHTLSTDLSDRPSGSVSALDAEQRRSTRPRLTLVFSVAKPIGLGKRT